MPHGLIHGVNRPIVHGVKHNLASLWGVSVPTDGGGIYVPQTNAQMVAVTGRTPTSIWLCQEASGNLADVNGTNTLTKTATGHLYQQTVSGWTRKAVATVDGTANQKWNNTTTVPSAGTTSVAILAYISTPAAAPAATRTLFAFGTTLEHRIASGSTAARLTVQAIHTDGAAGFANGSVRPVLLVYDRTGSNVTLSTNESNMTGTYSAAVTGPLVSLGAQGSTPANAGYLYATIFAGAEAEALTTIGARRSFLQALGWSIPW